MKCVPKDKKRRPKLYGNKVYPTLHLTILMQNINRIHLLTK